MVQNLNNNLITAPELSDLRKRLRNLDSRVRSPSNSSLTETNPSRRAKCSSWHSSDHGATTRCLLSRCVCSPKPTSRHTTSSKSCTLIPHQASQTLLTHSSAELEMTVNMLIQIDKLVQLLESPVFTCKQTPSIDMHTVY